MKIDNASLTVTPQELGLFLDTVASAPVALRDVPRINNVLARLVGLANSTGSIGVVPTEPSVVQTTGYVKMDPALAAAVRAAAVDD